MGLACRARGQNHDRGRRSVHGTRVPLLLHMGRDLGTVRGDIPRHLRDASHLQVLRGNIYIHVYTYIMCSLDLLPTLLMYVDHTCAVVRGVNVTQETPESIPGLAIKNLAVGAVVLGSHTARKISVWITSHHCRALVVEEQPQYELWHPRAMLLEASAMDPTCISYRLRLNAHVQNRITRGDPLVFCAPGMAIGEKYIECCSRHC